LDNSVETRRGGCARGYDAGKRVPGRKRHLLVDVMGLVLVAVVHSAGVQEDEGAREVLEHLRHRSCASYTKNLCVFRPSDYVS
jgi:putative transposase